MIVTRLPSIFALVVSCGLLPPVDAARGGAAGLGAAGAMTGAAGAAGAAATTGTGAAAGALIVLQAGVRIPTTAAVRKAEARRSLFMGRGDNGLERAARRDDEARVAAGWDDKTGCICSRWKAFEANEESLLMDGPRSFV